MPTYDYKCNACGHRFELFQSIKASPIKKCPECGKNAAERLIGTGGAIIFKGSGFYQTDYRSEAYRKSAEADKPTEGKPAEANAAGPKPEPGAKPAGDTKPDTPAAKTETKSEAKAAPAAQAASPSPGPSPSASKSARKPSSKPTPRRAKGKR